MDAFQIADERSRMKAKAGEAELRPVKMMLRASLMVALMAAKKASRSRLFDRALSTKQAGRHATVHLVMMGLLALTGCARPKPNEQEVTAIRSQAEFLMSRSPREQWVVPKAQWPPAIAQLEPKKVTVEADGVDILTKPFLDGGWGYLIVRPGQVLPAPAGRFLAMGKGVYSYHPG